MPTVEEKIAQIEKFLTERFGYSNLPVPTPDVIEVTDLTAIKTQGKYKLKAGTYNPTASYIIPDNTEVDVTGSTFNFSGATYTAVFTAKKNVKITGGTYKVNRTNFIYLGYSDCQNITMELQTLASGSGWAYKVSGGTNYTFHRLMATTWYNYLLFVEADAQNVTASNWIVIGGSENESCIRVCGCNNLTIKDSKLHEGLNPIGAKKSVAIRLHEGSNYTINNVDVRGNVGIGPMGGGDGGQNWATTQWIDKNGKWYVPKEEADMTKTIAQRNKTLALRTTNVRLNDVRIVEGKCQINAGAIDVVWDGGSITNTTPPEQPNWPANNNCFYGYVKQYPEGKAPYSVLLPTDQPRPAPDITINNVTLIGKLEDVKGYVKVGSGNTLNGKAI